MKRPLADTLCGLAAVAVFIGAALVTVVSPASAQTWPDRPVRIVSVSGAGSGVDDYSRQLASYVSAKLGQSFVVENRPGANTIIAPDGYKLFIAAIHEAQKVSAVDVPYKSSALLMQDLVGGQMDYSVLEVSAVAPMVQAGRIRALVVVAPVRVQALPDVPTLAEAGVRGVSLMSWTALFAPAGTPAAIVEKLARAALEFVDSPQARAHYAQRGTLAYPGSGPELAKTIVDDREQWKRLADLAGMQAQ